MHGLPDNENFAAQPVSVIQEHIASGQSAPLAEFLPIEIRVLVSAQCHAEGICTGTAVFPPGATLPYHVHDCGEAITILSGHANVSVEGRRYRLGRLDCMYLPAGTAHSVSNLDPAASLVAHTAFSTAKPGRVPVAAMFHHQDRDAGSPKPGEPECLMRFGQAQMYELAKGTQFCDLFASRFGSVGICGGYGEFKAGSSLPCHVHKFDESITIVTGESVCQVQGRKYILSGCDTAFVPEGKPHRFLNQSDSMMAMIWVYAGDEPERTLVSADYCSGSRAWPGIEAWEGTDREHSEV